MEDILNNVRPIIHQALEEDLGDGDVTTLCTVPPDARLKGSFIAKQDGVVAGLEVVRLTFALIDTKVELTTHVHDGEWIEKGTVIANISGPGRAILSGERVALNLLQRMSGIATLTSRFVHAVQGTSVVILDTRKTVPGLRYLDKWAVKLGGGQNHRFGLFDMVMIKDNHISAVGSITGAVERIRAQDDRKRPIEVEVKNLDELREVLELEVDRVMLDNMTLDKMREAVRITNGRVQLEASGNVSLETIADIAATGVDYISVGMLTHSVKAMDINLLLK